MNFYMLFFSRSNLSYQILMQSFHILSFLLTACIHTQTLTHVRTVKPYSVKDSLSPIVSPTIRKKLSHSSFGSSTGFEFGGSILLSDLQLAVGHLKVAFESNMCLGMHMCVCVCVCVCICMCVCVCVCMCVCIRV